MGRLPITLQDIAARTGVSKVTVSYVLNGRETRVRISDSTRQRVLAAAREMGYAPNAVARALARRRTDTITLVMQSPSVFSGGSGFMSELMHGVLATANEVGYDLLLHTKSLPTVREEVTALTDGRSDGLLLLRDWDDPLTQELQARHTPCVSLFARQPGAESCFVDCDNRQGARLATEYLLGLGHRRIGYVGGNPASAAVRDRWEGFTETLANHGMAHQTNWDCTVTFQHGDFTPLLDVMRRPDAPTALFVWSDDVAVGAMDALRKHLSLRVPDDVSIVGYDGTEMLCERAHPPLTSVRQPIYDIAARAVCLLARSIGHLPPAPDDDGSCQILLPPELLVRASCAPPETPSYVNAALPHSSKGHSDVSS